MPYKNPAERKACKRAAYLRKRAEILEARKAYYKAHKGEIILKVHRWKQAHPEAVRAWRREQNKRRRSITALREARAAKPSPNLVAQRLLAIATERARYGYSGTLKPKGF